MAFTADDPVASGRNYNVTEVDGHQPEALSDFVGDTWLTMVRDGMSLRMIGDGNATGDGVRFYQKDPGPADRDVRVWVITDGGDGTFLAEPLAAF